MQDLSPPALGSDDRATAHAPTADAADADAPTGALALADGTVFLGQGFGAAGMAVGEACFNTSLTGYQEILTDPSYSGQIITFTFPHIGNVGCTPEDLEASQPLARGLVVRADVTEPSNWRATQPLQEWLIAHNMIGLSGIDTRRLTRRIRDGGAPNAAIVHAPDGKLDLDAAIAAARAWPGLKGMDLAKDAACRRAYSWNEGVWRWPDGVARSDDADLHVVAVDFGAKRNILRCLVSVGCRVTVVPATATAEEILAFSPDGVFLSNGPGDPAATGVYAVPMIQELMRRDMPLFGICLGHQMMSLAAGGRTEKMARGHRGGNHPVKDLTTGKVEITSQNHGFEVLADSLPANAVVTHVSLFDGSNEGVRLTDRPAFSVQYHPEASPGPQDSHYLFDRFVDLIKAAR